MARYDRIAPLPAPSREDAFPGWPVLRDLENRERDAELARRARLRFLALRPLLRLLAQGPEAVSPASYSRQLDGIREELGHLPSRDPERVRLSRYLHEVEDRTPAALAAAAAGLGDVAEEAGNPGAAEEFYRTSAELARAFGLGAAEAAAYRRLGLLSLNIGQDAEADAQFEEATRSAADAGARAEWARALRARATLDLRRGEPKRAAAAVADVLERGQAWGDADVRSIGSAAEAQLALAAGDADAALEHAWTALELASDNAERSDALEHAAAALRALGLYETASRCYDLILRNGPAAPDRWRFEADLVATLAEAGDDDSFLAARTRLLREARVAPPPRGAGEFHLRMARACLHQGATDFARDHLREGLEAARRGGYLPLVGELERLLPGLERASARELPARRSPGQRALVIAGAIEAKSATPVR